MIDRKIVKFKARRGTEAQRLQITPDEGEFYYATDANKVFIGDNVTTGGVTIASKAYVVPSLSADSLSALIVPSFAYQNDTVFNQESGRYYIVDLDTNTDSLYLEMIGSNLTSGSLTAANIPNNSITLTQLASSIVDPNGAIVIGVTGLRINYDATTLGINGSNELTVLPGVAGSSIRINTNTGGLVNGIDLGVAVNPDNSSIIITNNKVSVVNYDELVTKINDVYSTVFGTSSSDTPTTNPDGTTTDDNNPDTTYGDVSTYVKPYVVKKFPVSKHMGRSGMVMMHDGNLNTWGNTSWGKTGSGKYNANSNYFRSLFEGSYLLDNSTVTITKVVRTFANAYALLSDGTLWSTGYNGLGNLGLSGIAVDTYYDGSYSYIFRKITFPNEDGSEALIEKFDVGGDSRQANGSDFSIHGLAISTNGNVYTWGSNVYGECGATSDTSKTYIGSPKDTGVTGGVKVFCARTYTGRQGVSYILNTEGKILASGFGGNGTLGTGNTNNISNFQEVPISQSGTPWAKFASPAGIVKRSDGSFYVVDFFGQSIRKITTTGTITTYAGLSTKNGMTANNVNGSTARFYGPTGITRDSSDNLYIADRYNNRIRKIDTSGNVTVFSGLSAATGTSAGVASNVSRLRARFNQPQGIVCDQNNNNILYVSDYVNQCVRSIKNNGNADTDTVETIAGIQGAAGNINGALGANKLYYPAQLAIGNVNRNIIYVADYGNKIIRKIDLSTSNKTVTSVARLSGLGNVFGIAISSDDNFAYITSHTTHCVYRVCLKDNGSFREGDKQIIAGVSGKLGLSNGNSTDQTNSKILFSYPTSLYLDGTSLYVTEGSLGSRDVGNDSIRKITLKSDGTLDTIETFAGNANWGGNDGICSLDTNASVNDPLVDIHGNPGSIKNIYLRTQSGYVYAAGKNTYGQLGQGNTTDSSTFIKVKYNSSDLANVTDLAVSGEATVMATVANDSQHKTENQLYVWGYNTNGTVGNGTTTHASSPYVATYLPTSVKRMIPCWTWGVANIAHAVVLDDGSLWASGATGTDKVFGNSITTDLLSFTRIYLPSKNVVDAQIITVYSDSGGNATGTLVLTDDGKLYQSGSAEAYFTGYTNQALNEYREVRF